MKALNVPYSENVRFIHINDFINIFDLDNIAREAIEGENGLLAQISNAFASREGIGNLYQLYVKESDYLYQIRLRYQVGWRPLSNLPF